METESSLPSSQNPATGTCPEPIESSSYPHVTSRLRNFSVILPPAPISPTWLLPFWFSFQNFVCVSHNPVCATCPAYLILVYWSPE